MTSENRDGWRAHLLRIEQEQLTTKAYADREGLSAAVLYHWRKVFKAEARRALRAPEGAAQAGPQGSFVALTVTDVRVRDVRQPVPPVGCRLTLPAGLQLEMVELPAPQWLARLAADLMRERC